VSRNAKLEKFESLAPHVQSRERRLRVNRFVNRTPRNGMRQGETEQTERAMLIRVRRDYRVRERSSETPETCVVLLITQRRRPA
jgi:hypothetical protein